MKLSFIAVCFLIIFQSQAQEGSIMYEEDTLVITNSELLNDPFRLGKEPSVTLIKKASSIESISHPNLHVENQIDTLIHIIVVNDSFQIYKNPTIDFLIHAVVSSENFPVQHSVKVGMKKSNVKKKLKIKAKGALPNFIKIRDFEYMTWLDFSFEKKRLSKIRYTALID